MNQQLPIIATGIAVIVILFVFMLIALSRYTKVGPNMVLIISGRKIRLPNGQVVGYRIVKNGGTFVFPVIEKAEVLSLEIFALESTRWRTQTADNPVQLDYAAQLRINSDDASIIAAAQSFLGKTPDQMKAIIKPVLEAQLSRTLGSVPAQEVIARPAAIAAQAQTNTTASLAKLGLDLLSLTITNPRLA